MWTAKSKLSFLCAFLLDVDELKAERFGSQFASESKIGTIDYKGGIS